MPGSANFVGEFYILNGLFQEKIVFAFVAISGVAMSAYYALRLYQRTMHNRPASQQSNGVVSREIGLGDGLVLVPLVLCIIGLALYPQLVLKRTDASVNRTVASTCAARSITYSSVSELEEAVRNGDPFCLSPALAKRIIAPKVVDSR